MRAWPAAAALMGALAIGAVGATAAPPMRIVSLAPGVTEILFALGAGGAVVGVSQYCDYPPAATRLPKVGTFLTPNVEAIAAGGSREAGPTVGGYRGSMWLPAGPGWGWWTASR